MNDMSNNGTTKNAHCSTGRPGQQPDKADLPENWYVGSPSVSERRTLFERPTSESESIQSEVDRARRSRKKNQERRKRVRTEIDSDDDHQVDYAASRNRASEVRAEISSFLVDAKNKCPKVAASFVIERIDELAEIINRMAVENAFLAGIVRMQTEGDPKADAVTTAEAVADILAPTLKGLTEDLRNVARNPATVSISPIQTAMNAIKECEKNLTTLSKQVGGRLAKAAPKKPLRQKKITLPEEQSTPKSRRQKSPTRITDPTSGDEKQENELMTVDSTEEREIEPWSRIVGRKKREKRDKKSKVSTEAKTSIERKVPVAGPNPGTLILVEPSTSLKGSELMTKVKEILDPRKSGIKIDGLRQTAKGGVAIRVENKEMKDKIFKLDGFRTAEIEVKGLSRNRPKLLILRVPVDITRETLAKEIYDFNECQGNFEESDIIPLYTVKYERRGASTAAQFQSWVVELHPQLWAKIVDRKRVYLMYQSCYVRSYTGVTRCYRCQQYGHVAKACFAETPICGYCAKGHDTRECTDKTRVSCANCHKFGYDAKHLAGSFQCTSHRNALSLMREMTDYGQESQSGSNLKNGENNEIKTKDTKETEQSSAKTDPTSCEGMQVDADDRADEQSNKEDAPLTRVTPL